jgi:hypothetical protein
MGHSLETAWDTVGETGCGTRRRRVCPVARWGGVADARAPGGAATGTLAHCVGRQYRNRYMTGADSAVRVLDARRESHERAGRDR